MKGVVVALVACAALGGACRFDTWRFYDVDRVPQDVCTIRPEGEFCDSDVKPPNENEGWSVERNGDLVRIYVDDEVWQATVNEEDDTKLKASKLEIATVEPCTTTRERSLSTTDDGEKLTGKLLDKTRITGGEDCGEVPRGDRVTYDLDGAFVGSP